MKFEIPVIQKLQKRGGYENYKKRDENYHFYENYKKCDKNYKKWYDKCIFDENYHFTKTTKKPGLYRFRVYTTFHRLQNIRKKLKHFFTESLIDLPLDQIYS